MNQIKVLAFDLMGVLLTEKDINNPYYQAIDSDIDLEDHKYSKAEYFELFNKYYYIRDPSVFDLSKIYKFAIASNHISEMRDYLKDLDIIKYFSPILISAEIGLRKPDPKFYEKLISEVGESPENILFIDDRPENIDGAKQVGLKTFLFNPNHNQMNLREQLEKELLKYELC